MEPLPLLPNLFSVERYLQAAERETLTQLNDKIFNLQSVLPGKYARVIVAQNMQEMPIND